MKLLDGVADFVNHNETIAESIDAHLEAPCLCGISTKHLSDFKKARTLAEKQLQEKGRQIAIELVGTSCKASIEGADLKSLLAAGWIKAANTATISQQQFK